MEPPDISGIQQEDNPKVTVEDRTKSKPGLLIFRLLGLVWFCIEDVPLVEFMYLVFTHVPGESHCRQLRSFLLYLCSIFRALINSLVC